jgi:hypothetical protein
VPENCSGGKEPSIGELIAQLEDAAHVRAWEIAVARVRDIIFPEYVAMNWSSTTKFYGGRVPSHSIPFFFIDIVAKIRGISGADVSRGALQAMRMIITAKVAAFLIFFNAFATSTACSIVRLRQLAVDGLYLIRYVRLLGVYYDEGAVDDLLLRTVAIMSLRTADRDTRAGLLPRISEGSPRILRNGSDASAEDMKEIPPEFRSAVWDVPPLDVTTLPVQSLFAPLSSTFAQPVNHHELEVVSYPSPSSSLCALRRTPLGTGKQLIEVLSAEEVTCALAADN